MYPRFMDGETALRELRASAKELRDAYGVVGATLFGSAARGAPAPRDLDVAIEFSGEPDVMALCGVAGLLTERLGVDVDVVARPVKNPSLAKAIADQGLVAF
ncbi:MAG: nucleotidyltransferase domain-containing protein [Pseudomonadota bacterium]